ncbi:hypothetical protein C0J52_23368 [Blattella germanica]|nr:hypothetical protein C0J52_23368 [Blattella germanica]
MWHRFESLKSKRSYALLIFPFVCYLRLHVIVVRCVQFLLKKKNEEDSGSDSDFSSDDSVADRDYKPSCSDLEHSDGDSSNSETGRNDNCNNTVEAEENLIVADNDPEITNVFDTDASINVGNVDTPVLCYETMLKRKINPTQLKVGISSMKASRDGRLIIESGKKEDIDVLSKHIEDQCSQLLEFNIPKLRNPDIIVFNIPEDIAEQNAAEIISLQNPELNLQENTLMP